MLTRDEFLKKIGKTDVQLEAEGLELCFIGPQCYAHEDEEDGWEVVYKDPTKSVQVGLGCKCSQGGTLHDKL